MTNGRTTISDEEAETLFKQAKSRDPLPFIPPALLNSSDIHEYATSTGMIAPYDKEYLKSSSYEVQLGNEVIYWDEDNEKKHLYLEENEEVTLKPNSLIFFKTKQTFRLPDYIAVRFNLRITNVHRGLLLGTGPLVDPGFEGHILIPIHNLTTNSYSFKAGESLIWVEFTKVSPNSGWQDIQSDEYKDFIDFVKFPENKKYIDPAKYLSKAAPHNPIRNAVPEAIYKAQSLAEESRKNADEAEQVAKSIRNWITIGGIVAALAIIIPIYNLISDTNSYIQEINSERREYEDITARLRALEAELQKLEERSQETSANPDESAEQQ